MAYLPPSPDQLNAANSTTATLTANSVFTGTSVDLTANAVSKITIMAFSDQASAAGGLAVQYSEDNANWDRVITTTVTAAVGSDVIVGVLGRYMRVVYTNGAVNQATFRLQTLLSQFPVTPVTRDLDTAVQSTDNASVTRAVLSGLSPTNNKYTNVATDVLGNLSISAGGAGSDAFDRMRVSEPETLFNVTFEYDTQPLLMQAVINGSATATKTTNVSSVTLSTVDGTTAHGVDFQSHGYYRYEPGKSQLIIMTGLIGAATANVRSQIGYYDANNGVFFDQNNGIGVTQRSNTSGSPVDTFVAQANWNIDKCNGTGPSGFNADFTKTQIFFIDLQWLGVGRVRFGFFDKGVPVIAHEIYNDNSIAVPYMNTACLPICWSIHNTGAASGATTMTANCASILSEAGNDIPSALTFGVGNTSLVSTITTTRTALMTIRPKLLFNSITNRTRISLQDLDIYNNDGTASGYWELVYNGTLGGSPAYTSVDVNSGVEFDVAGTTCTGGTVLAAGVAQGSHNLTQVLLRIKECPTLSASGSVQDLITLCLRAYSATLSGASGAIRWREER